MESQSERGNGGNRGRGDGGGGGQRRNYYPRRGGGGGRGRGGGGGYSNNQGYDDGGGGRGRGGGRGGYTNNQDNDNGGGGGGRGRGGRRGGGGYSNNQGGDDEGGNWRRRERGGGGGRGGDHWSGRDYNNSRGRGGSGNGGGRGYRNNNYPSGGARRQEEEGNREDFSLNPDAPSFQPNSRNDNDNSNSSPPSQSTGLPALMMLPKEISTARLQHHMQQRPRPSKNQKETLTDHLNRNSLECMVCCEKVRYSQPIWSCRRCFNIFHLNCIRKWVEKSDDEGGWRCPSCQSLCPSSSTPLGYYCFCGKTKSPKPSRHEVPHTCSQICGRSRPTCQHSCPHPCHPGPCPPCENQETRYCGCGATSAIFLCTSQTLLTCDRPCNKTLPCTLHKCTLTCHSDPCPPCPSKVTLSCYCNSSPKKVVPCTPSTSSSPPFYCCPLPCSKRLSCGTHLCPKICHPGSCPPCPTSPQVLLSCPCGQTSISKACALQKLPPRRLCTDPIPTCGRTCSKILPCGDDLTFHTCQSPCHLSPSCPPCSRTSNVKCRCGSKTKEIKCVTLIALRSTSEEVTCQKKCSKKRSCGKHKCLNTCCIDFDHICPLPCQRALSCGLHKCDRLCHALQGPCPPCPLASFDELTCECGNAVIYPPVPCGTKRPPCPMPCSRTHECDHQVLHPCHSEPNCPPCTVLTEKWCHGTHELRKNVPCHISSLSCGLPCKKGLSCGRHSCPKTCHAGACLEPGEICKLACSKPRESCGHICGAPCHEGGCPENKCKIMTQVTCLCGRRSDSLVCWKRENEYDRLITWEYHKELKRIQEDAKKEWTTPLGEGEVEAVPTKEEIMARLKLRFGKCGVLECDKECAKEERNRKLAEALQVEDGGDPCARGGSGGDSTGIGPPNYSEFLITFCKKQPQFVELVHKQLTDLVVKAKQQSHKKNVTYGFNSMNRDKRHVVHEYSDYFGVRSESFDEEPNRNVVCFASKEKSYLPTMSLIDFVFRPLSTLRSERLKPHEDVIIRPEKRAQIQGPSNIWNNRAKLPTASTPLSSQDGAGGGGGSVTSQMVRLNIPRGAGGSGLPSSNSFSSAATAVASPSCSDFPAL